MDAHPDFAVLGLAEPTIELRAIKSAYARLLRIHRPEEDAQTFQALSEAYERALAWARQQLGAARGALPADASATVSPAGPDLAVAQPTPTGASTVPQPAPVDPMAIARRLLEQALRDGLTEDWLEQQPDLLGITVRQRVALTLAELLDETSLLPAMQSLDRLAAFFGWEPLTLPAAAARALSRAQAHQWLHEDAAARYEQFDTPTEFAHICKLLLRPFRWWDYLTLNEQYMEMGLHRIGQLDLETLGQTARILPPDTLAFWRQWGSLRTLVPARLFMSAVQAIVFSLVCTALLMIRPNGSSALHAPPLWAMVIFPVTFGFMLARHTVQVRRSHRRVRHR